MTVIGTKLTSFVWPGLQIGAAGNNMRGIAPITFVAPSAGYATRIGGFAREISNSNPFVYYAIYALDEDGTPVQQLGRTARIAINGAGGDFSGGIVWSDPDLKGLLTASRLVAGQRYAIAPKIEAGTAEFATLPGTTMHFLRNVAGNAVPPDPFNLTATDPAGPVLALYIEFTENQVPSTVITSPVNNAVINSTEPTYTGSFSDPQMGAPIGDRMSAYALEVTRVADGELIWGGAGAVFAATDAERNANTWSRKHAGAVMPAGTGPYQIIAKVFDDSGAGSAWSAPIQFSINAAGQVTVSDATAPPAKVETVSGEIVWGGKWFHPTTLAMNAAQVRVWIGEDTILKEGALVPFSPTIASSAAPGTAFTIPYASAGIGTLAPGREYSYDIRGRATDGQLSPYSDRRYFVVNSPPTRPSNLQPPDGSVSSNRPIAEWNVSDPDPDDVYGIDDDSRIELKRPNGTSAVITTTNYDPLTGKGWYEFLSSEVLDAVRGRYQWRVQGRDLSAGALGEGEYSPWQSFDYVAGPVPDIANPAAGDVVDTSVPIITWDILSGTQVRYKVRVYNVDDDTPLKESKEITSTVQGFQVPAGWLRNHGEYDAEVTIWDGANQKGVSLRRQFSVSYTGPTALGNVEGSLYGNRLDPIIGGIQEPSSIVISWLQTNLPPAEFGGYLPRRRYAGQTLDEAVIFPIITNPGQNLWIDHLAPANVPLIYSVSQLRRVSSEETLESEPVEIAIQLPRRVPILCSATAPGDLRISGMWMANDLSGGFTRDQALERTWGSGQKRIHNRPPRAYGAKRVQLSITVKSDERASLYDHLDAIDDLVESGDVLLWGPPRNRERMFCAIEGDANWKRSGLDKRSRQFTLVEVDWNEGLRAENTGA